MPKIEPSVSAGTALQYVANYLQIGYLPSVFTLHSAIQHIPKHENNPMPCPEEFFQ
jgi:hypothetical protein